MRAARVGALMCTAGQKSKMGLDIQNMDVMHDLATSVALPSDALKDRELQASLER